MSNSNLLQKMCEMKSEWSSIAIIQPQNLNEHFLLCSYCIPMMFIMHLIVHPAGRSTKAPQVRKGSHQLPITVLVHKPKSIAANQNVFQLTNFGKPTFHLMM